MKKIYVADVTLKAIVEQGLNLTFREKLTIAERLDLAHVDCIELGALHDNKETEIIYRTISKSLKSATLKVAVGNDDSTYNLALDCVKKSKGGCLQVVMPVSTVQMEYFYHLKAKAMQERIGELVAKAKKDCKDVEFVALDAFRAEEGFLISCIKTALENGATSITICDDEGVAFPQDYYNVVKEIKAVCQQKVFVQPSNTLSMAGACAVEAIKAGADGVKTSICGNYLSLALFADIIRAKKDILGADCGVDVTNVKTISNAIDEVVTSENDASEQNTSNDYINYNATMKEVADKIKQLGYELIDKDLGNVYDEFKRLTAKKEDIDVKELEALIASTAMQVPSTYHLVNYVVNSGNIIPATANITLEKDGQKFTGVSTGDGPIDAAFHAIEQIIGHHYELDDFQVHAITKGRGAVGSSIIRLRADGKLYPGNGVSTDIVGACIRAYINALNKIVYEEN